MKKIISMIIAFLVITSYGSYAKTLEFTMNNENLYIDDFKTIENKQLETAPYTENDRTIVPVRVITENFLAEVLWDETTNKVTISKNDKNVVFTLGSNIAYVNGEEKTLDVTVREINGRTMVPLRFLAETFGYHVYYNEMLDKLYITDLSPAFSINGKKVSIDYIKTIADTYGLSMDSKENVENLINYAKETVLLSGLYVEKDGITITDELEDAKKDLTENSNEYYKYSILVPQFEFIENYIGTTCYVASVIKDFPAISDKETDNFYNENYVTAKHILISTIDTETGLPLSDTEKAKAKKTADDLYKKIKNGYNFDKLMNEYSVDPGIKSYPDGYTFTKGEMVYEFENTAFELEIGKFSSVVETPYGYHIIKREKLSPITEEITNEIEKNYTLDLYHEHYTKLFENAEITDYLTTEEITSLFK